MRRYEIRITETEHEEQVCGKDWKEGVGPSGEYGYTPEIIKISPVTRTIYTQNTDALDLIGVILAVNGIPTSDQELP